MGNLCTISIDIVYKANIYHEPITVSDVLCAPSINMHVCLHSKKQQAQARIDKRQRRYAMQHDVAVARRWLAPDGSVFGSKRAARPKWTGLRRGERASAVMWCPAAEQSQAPCKNTSPTLACTVGARARARSAVKRQAKKAKLEGMEYGST